MTKVRISELKNHLAKHLRAAEAGEVIEVLDRARAIARLVPVAREDEGLELVPAERPFRAVRRVRLPWLDLPMSSLDALEEERGTR